MTLHHPVEHGTHDALMAHWGLSPLKLAEWWASREVEIELHKKGRAIADSALEP
jgi:hypothetical protein